MTILRYLINGFLLILPALIWNIIFTRFLPGGFSSENYDRNVPRRLMFLENILRVPVFFLPVYMPIGLDTTVQKAGLALYLAGIFLYCASWLFEIFFPLSGWSRSKAGFLAPAYTPIVWLTGIGMMTGSSFGIEPTRISAFYISLSLLFLSIHLKHASIAFDNINRLD